MNTTTAVMGQPTLASIWLPVAGPPKVTDLWRGRPDGYGLTDLILTHSQSLSGDSAGRGRVFTVALAFGSGTLGRAQPLPLL